MERYAVSWSDVGADPNDGFDGFSTARFATLREAIPCAVRHGGIIHNMKERPADGGGRRGSTMSRVGGRRPGGHGVMPAAASLPQPIPSCLTCALRANP